MDECLIEENDVRVNMLSEVKKINKSSRFLELIIYCEWVDSLF